jgi:O-antigen ligase
LTVPVDKSLKARNTDGSSPPLALPKRIVFIPAPSVSVPTVVRLTFLLFVFILPFETANNLIKSSPLTLIKMPAYLFFASCLLYPNKCFSHLPHALWWFLGYLIIFTLNGLVIPGQFVGGFFSKFFTWIQLITFFWIASCLLQEESLAKSVLLTFSVAAVLLSLGTIFHVPGFVDATEQIHSGARMTAFEGNPNTAGFLTAFAAVILIGLLLDKTVRSLWSKVSLAALTLPLFLLNVRSGSRAGIGALIIGISLYLLPYRGAKQKMVRMIWAALTIVGVMYMVISNPTSSRRWEAVSEGDAANRQNIYPAAVDMIVERPIFGWQPVVASYELGKRVNNVARPLSAHNLWLHLLTEVGIVGTVPFLVALWLCVRAAWKARIGPLGMLPLALLVTFLAYSMAHAGWALKPVWLFLSLAVAAPFSRVRGRKGRLTSVGFSTGLHDCDKIEA